jgi:Domain of unknown function (DUF4263)
MADPALMRIGLNIVRSHSHVMPTDRLTRWKKATPLLTFLSGDNKEQLETLSKLQGAALQDKPKEGIGFTQGGMIQACRELIFDLRDGVPIFHAIMYGIDTDQVAVKLEHMFEILVEGKQSEEEIDEDVRNTLAVAAGYSIPVYPNNEKVAPILAKFHRRMLIDGFTAPDGKGSRVRLKLTKSPGKRISDPTLFNELDPTEMVSPADLLLMREALAAEMASLSGARRVVVGIRQAIGELESLLSSSARNENSIQRCLTANPLLFGPEYLRIIPKHRLGSEFEMDYALERHSGLVDLVEIESSSLALFNKKGDPSSHLVHAEHQVIDWLHWIEVNNPYARRGLPGLANPMGFVVIGRSHTLREVDAERLHRRNAILQPRLTILTYDQLLERARQILKAFEVAGRGSR